MPSLGWSREKRIAMEDERKKSEARNNSNQKQNKTILSGIHPWGEHRILGYIQRRKRRLKEVNELLRAAQLASTEQDLNPGLPGSEGPSLCLLPHDYSLTPLCRSPSSLLLQAPLYHLHVLHRLIHCHATLPSSLLPGTVSDTQAVLLISMTPKSST